LGYLINRSFYAETITNNSSPSKRRLSKLDSSNEIEYRNFLNNFINDVLEVLDRPEWPSASIILVTFCKLVNILNIYIYIYIYIFIKIKDLDKHIKYNIFTNMFELYIYIY